MKVLALASFRTKLRPESIGTVVIQPGDVLDVPTEHAMALARNRLVSIAAEYETTEAPAPETPEQPKPVKRGKGKGKK